MLSFFVIDEWLAAAAAVLPHFPPYWNGDSTLWPSCWLFQDDNEIARLILPMNSHAGWTKFPSFPSTNWAVWLLINCLFISNTKNSGCSWVFPPRISEGQVTYWQTFFELYETMHNYVNSVDPWQAFMLFFFDSTQVQSIFVVQSNSCCWIIHLDDFIIDDLKDLFNLLYFDKNKGNAIHKTDFMTLFSRAFKFSFVTVYGSSVLLISKSIIFLRTLIVLPMYIRQPIPQALRKLSSFIIQQKCIFGTQVHQLLRVISLILLPKLIRFLLIIMTRLLPITLPHLRIIMFVIQQIGLLWTIIRSRDCTR